MKIARWEKYRRAAVGCLALGVVIFFGAAMVGAVGENRCPDGFDEVTTGCLFHDAALTFEIPPNGLLRPWPAMGDVAVASVNVNTVALGRLLFFDPIVSGDNTASCAHCHDPSQGLADGQRLGHGKGATGVGLKRQGGKTLPRHTPTVYNSAFDGFLFWDGRARTLEHQAMFPITSADEMNQPLDLLAGELAGNAEYRRLFSQAFGQPEKDAVNIPNILTALSAFERTLLSTDSRYDRYVLGDEAALSDAEKRGLNVFRGLNTRCFECHVPPSFSGTGLFTVGVPPVKGDPPDIGAMAQNPTEGMRESFKVPTLRNIALTAPYMHNGSMKTLEEIIDFYGKGGGAGVGHDLPNINRQVMKFKLHGTEKEDLAAFLKSLTDDSRKPMAPEKVPSGLPVMK